MPMRALARRCPQRSVGRQYSPGAPGNPRSQEYLETHESHRVFADEEGAYHFVEFAIALEARGGTRQASPASPILFFLPNSD